MSIILGVLGLLLAPVAVLMTMGEIEPPDVSVDLDQSAWIQSLDDEQQAKIAQMETDGQTIAEVMKSLGMQEQTIKAQLLYFSCFNGAELTDYLAYGNLFANATDDAALIESINQTYGLEIVYEDYLRSYVAVMNSTVNPYLFSDTATKNAADLVAWMRNAYVSGWEFESGMIGEMNPELRYRTADNAGVILGYLRYNPTEKTFGSEPDLLYYTARGTMDTMPDAAGVGVFDGTDFGVYVGNGEVIFSSSDGGCVVREPLGNRDWTAWCTFDAVTYPQEVTDAIDQATTTEPTEEGA